ncbi:hypothetical protein S7711_09896 [Stachybotrys chartarum IBT 7711]|uniref:Ubiquinol-cytochrome-c reductase cytochrome c1 n=1 Tax=Stachybotrys chartarum (strain CBS 109288 / IBT 7711) TaxID=1280523 RepID=A0A084BAU0_STACB|nr:hypothetical protein S7711_09896 [Stachybotrys chartarum IBT 7711]
MANKNPPPPPPDERVIYLAFKNVFKGQEAAIRNTKPIRKLIQKHQGQNAVADLVREHNIDVLCTATQVLLSQEIFSSTLKAKLRFPELFEPSPNQSAEKEASEAEAARHEADAIEQVVQSQHEIAEPPPEKPPPSTLKEKDLGHPSTDASAGIPSLFPTYLPFPIQHKLLVHLQNLLERACYEFGVHAMSSTLRDRQWNCAESVELNRWTDEVFKRKCILANAGHTGVSLDEVLRSVANIRHTAVHRLRVSAKAIQQFLLDAETLATLLRNHVYIENIGKLRRETQTIIEELEQNKHFLRSRLDETLQRIASQRAELELMEEMAIAKMKKEDDEYQTLAGRSLEEAIEPSEASFSTAFETEQDLMIKAGCDEGKGANNDDDDDDMVEENQLEQEWDV